MYDHCIMHHVYSQILEVYASAVHQNFFRIDPIINVSRTQLFHFDLAYKLKSICDIRKGINQLPKYC